MRRERGSERAQWTEERTKKAKRRFMTARLAYYTDKSHPWSCFSEVHVCVFKKDLSCVHSSSFILRQWTHLPRARRQIRFVCQRLTHATQKTGSRDVDAVFQ